MHSGFCCELGYRSVVSPPTWTVCSFADYMFTNQTLCWPCTPSAASCQHTVQHGFVPAQFHASHQPTHVAEVTGSCIR